MSNQATLARPYEKTDGLSYTEWQLGRRQYIGGSEVAAILGNNPYKTPLQVWKEKQGESYPIQDTGIMEFGRIFEPQMADKFTTTTGLTVQNDNKIRIHPHFYHLRANIDRLIISNEQYDGPGILELKTTNSYSVKNWDGDYPLTWKYQIQYYMAITGYQYAFLQVYERDTCQWHQPLYIARDTAFIEKMIAGVVDWWDKHIIAGVQPDPISDDDLLMLYPDATESKTAKTSLHGYTQWQELHRVREDIDELKQYKESIERALKQQIGDAEELWFNDHKLCTWKQVHQHRFDSKQFAKDHPETHQKYLKPSSYRKFHLNKT